MNNGAALAALLLASCTVQKPASAISVSDAWARATVPGQTSSTAYFTMTNGGREDRLVGISSSAGRASLHVTSMADGVVRMRPVESVAVPARSTVTLEPGGTHVMLTGLSAPLRAGATFPLMLDFERSADRRIEVTVRSTAPDRARM